ncbi:ABC transporter ATP-binding protein [Sporosarcina sp. ACRSL]|uniref:ABC transporter ATP-binding protein n=1 Tax=Sporosarcina sp. ACRSL TaxID=2918215 RepID=UPI001EF4C074|nr:ABC transporter ATP-binding protein [Sporosarcina sp. ACRSL]MCG7344608.1 ABC transporter ATP-binding protein [Sporosarcina sp. ACRSL]
MQNVIDMKNVLFRRGQKEILKSINWTIKQNEHWAILGLNGSGKTSLLNIISAHQFPTEGEVHVLGNRFGETNLPELRKEIGFVSSSLERFAQTFQHDTVERVIISGKFASFGLYEQPSVADWERADELLHDFRLYYLKGKPFNLLSEGEKRRILITRALMNKPRMLIMDEPCSGLDILSREQFLHTLEAVTKNNCHLIYVTHHVEELVEDITHVLLLKEGEIVASGKKKEVLTGDLLTATYNVPVRIRWDDGRPYLTINKEMNEVSKQLKGSRMFT